MKKRDIFRWLALCGAEDSLFACFSIFFTFRCGFVVGVVFFLLSGFALGHVHRWEKVAKLDWREREQGWSGSGNG